MGYVAHESREARRARRDKDIRDMYDRLRDIKEYGVRIYTHEAILSRVAHKFYMSPSTINNIINGYATKTSGTNDDA